MTDVRRVAMISLHTSPLDQPGTGDAGGMNVYVVELARRLAGCGIEVDVFTRATSSALDPVVTLTDGVDVHHVPAGPFEGLTKHELPGQLCVFAREVLRAEAAQPVGHYDVVHSHYWLSGQVGALARDRWGVPLVHSMHTMAKVKNLALAADDQPEPTARVIGEEQVVEAADVLLANTAREADQLVELYDADPARVEVVHPGVDLDVFRPTGARTGGPGGPADAAGTALAREEARREVGLPPRGRVVLFCGRIQPLKGPHVLLRAVAALLVKAPDLRAGLVVPIVGGPSGSGLDRPTALAALAEELGVADVVRFVPPQPREALARWYAAADLVAVPSYNESFGLVAAEAQACGTPVVAASVGGLTTVVDHGRTGLLVDGHDPEVWAAALHRLLSDDEERSRLAAGAAAWARRFSWDATAQATLGVYQRARTLMRESGA